MNTDIPADDLHNGGHGHGRPPSGYDLDLDQYRGELAEFQLTEEEETELLQTLWNIMRHFVELGFGLNPGAELRSNFNQASETDQSNDKFEPSTTTENKPRKAKKERSP